MGYVFSFPGGYPQVVFLRIYFGLDSNFAKRTRQQMDRCFFSSFPVFFGGQKNTMMADFIKHQHDLHVETLQYDFGGKHTISYNGRNSMQMPPHLLYTFTSENQNRVETEQNLTWRILLLGQCSTEKVRSRRLFQGLQATQRGCLFVVLTTVHHELTQRHYSSQLIKDSYFLRFIAE